MARALGIGAVKYADLSTDRNHDYVFDWDRMLAFEGDTGPYLQYAYARIRSIFRRAETDPPAPGGTPLLGEPQERALALQLLRFSEAVQSAAQTSSPSKLCTYLFDLAASFTAFYEACRVLGRRPGRAPVEARPVRSHGAGAQAGPVPPRDGGARTDVTGSRTAPILGSAPKHEESEKTWI